MTNNITVLQYTQVSFLVYIMACAVHLMANAVHKSEAPEVNDGLSSTLDG